MISQARAGTLRAEEDADAAGLRSAASTVQAAEGSSQSKFECVSWWKHWMSLDDQMPNEPTIVHRVVIWSSVYDEKYIPDMEWSGSAPSLSRERWTRLKNEALKELSIEYYGSLADVDDNDARRTAEQRQLR
eukprot:731651-Pleurochrysis_carterae.AAC.2